MTSSVKIPKRFVYKAAEVCAIAELQPYVLRSWEAEFSDLGTSKKGGGQRFYRQADLDKVLRIKELLFVEGLTLGAARRQLLKEEPSADAGEALPFEDLVSADARALVENLKVGLRSILAMLSESTNGAGGSQVEPVSRKTGRVRRASGSREKLRRKKA